MRRHLQFELDTGETIGVRFKIIGFSSNTIKGDFECGDSEGAAIYRNDACATGCRLQHSLGCESAQVRCGRSGFRQWRMAGSDDDEVDAKA